MIFLARLPMLSPNFETIKLSQCPYRAACPPPLGRGVHELRFRDRSGQYRVIYLLKVRDAIYLVHAFKKKSQTTPKKHIDVAIKRIKSL